MIVSPYKYAQWKEDVFLWKHLVQNKLRSKVPEFYIDIGASNGVSNSNSRYFVHLGWRVWLYEPDPTNYRLLCQNTNFRLLNEEKNGSLRDKVIAHNLAIGPKSGEIRFTSEGGLSRIDPNGPIRVKCQTVGRAFSRDAVRQGVGILDIDTEGGEEAILEDFLRITHPCFIIIEHQNEQHKMQKQEGILKDRYRRLRREGVNDIWQLKSL